MGAPPTAEVMDGIDNDCNGIVDDTPFSSVRTRALILALEYLYTDGAAEIATTSALLDAWGVPHDVSKQGIGFDAYLPSLDQYSLVILPGYLEGDALNNARRLALENYARAGGIVIVAKPFDTVTSVNARGLTGLTSSTRHVDVSALEFDGPGAAAFAAMDSPQERWLPVSSNPPVSQIAVYALEPNPAEGTVALASAMAGDVLVGAAVTRRPLDAGAIYAIGHDLHTYDVYTCYVNCFDPSVDVLGMFLRDAYREGCSGHSVLKHTVPGPEDSILFMTHDVDAPDAFNAGPWGAPGALQMQAVETAHMARGTYNITTDYVSGYYLPATVQDLCTGGSCPAGAHSVQHLANFSVQPLGTCTETAATYPGNVVDTLCGEVMVSQQLVTVATGHMPVTWRTPFLAVPPELFDVLADHGFIADSSYSVGDFKTALPIATDKVGFAQWLFHGRPLLEQVISCEDGIGFYVDGAEGRIELQQTNIDWFLANWRYVLYRNAANHAHTTVLIHPSYGIGVGEENLPWKIEAAHRLLTAADERGGVMTSTNVEEFTKFWRAREQVDIDAHFDTSTGYSGTIRVGALAMTGLTLELGDAISTFSCASCGTVEIHGKRVVLRSTLPPNTVATFTAQTQ